MKNVEKYFFIWKALFLLKIFNFFLCFLVIGKKWLDYSKNSLCHNLVNKQLQYTYCPLSLARKNICNLIAWEGYNIGRIWTCFQYLYSGAGKKIIRFFYYNIRIIEKRPHHKINNNQIFIKVIKYEVKKQKGFLQQYVLIFLGRNLETKSKKLKGWSLLDWLRYSRSFCGSEKERWHWLRTIIPCKYTSCFRSSPEGSEAGCMYSLLTSRKL